MEKISWIHRIFVPNNFNCCLIEKKNHESVKKFLCACNEKEIREVLNLFKEKNFLILGIGEIRNERAFIENFERKWMKVFYSEIDGLDSTTRSVILNANVELKIIHISEEIKYIIIHFL
jgi:hypothetical protein